MPTFAAPMFEDFATMFSTVSIPYDSWSCRIFPAKANRPFSQLKTLLNLTIPSLNADEMTTDLKVDRGSATSTSNRFFWAVGALRTPGLFGSKFGSDPIARIFPVFG